jgi:phosphoglycerol transferase MdoB-like AlkP superfamily enzyme
MGGSTDAVFLVNTSLYPVNNGGSTFFSYSLKHLEASLPKVLKRQNYTTYAFENHNKNTWNWANSVKDLGFDFQLGALQDFGIKKMDEKIYFDKIFDVLNGAKSPFYAHISTVASHMPYDIDIGGNKFNLPDNIVNKYFEVIHYADKLIANFISQLEKSNILENSIVVIYGDHESLHLFYEDEIHKFYPNEAWMENNLRIPVIIYSPHIKERKVDNIGGQIDIYPTIAYLLGIEDDVYYKKSVLGRNLLNTKRNFAISFYKDEIFGNTGEIGMDTESIYNYSEMIIRNKLR